MLRVDKVSYEVKGRKLLKDISLQIRKGELVAILGANGAGKSTLMHIISGELAPTEGYVQLASNNLADMDKRSLAQARAMLSQQQSIQMAFTVKELVIMGRYPHFKSSPSQKDWDIVSETMNICGIADFAERKYLSLSGGEQQRVQLARVLSQLWDNPDALLLLDEPISALDLHYQQKVLAIAKNLSRRGFMVVVVLHDINMAALYADRIIMLKNGRKWLDGTPAEVLNTKDIYTVFSVASTVDMDMDTVKPRIFFKEMELQQQNFNSMLPNPEIGKNRQWLAFEQLRQSHPDLPYPDLGRLLQLPALEVLSLEKDNQIIQLSLSVAELIPYLSQVGKIAVTICRQGLEFRTTLEKHRWVYLKEEVQCWNEDFLVLQMRCQQLSTALLKTPSETAILLHDSQGRVQVQIIILSDADISIVYPQLLTYQYPATVPDLTKHEVNSNRSDIDTQENLDKTAPNIQQGQPLSLAQLKQILAAISKAGLDSAFTLSEDGLVHHFAGKIHHLIDQGQRYAIRSTTMDCQIWPGRIEGIQGNYKEAGQSVHFTMNIRDTSAGTLQLSVNVSQSWASILPAWKDLAHSI